ncbi:SDR family NAD(P)-dependent oxidoreductase [Amycolatopsis nigrescens]|uniref:SDR family NAD(P)-dependent oxidoreductase n=1 Tax=Amycolatopsis nigrescens TaxID=381445 RepID=UPI000362192F|nr:SDR family NAD(P)-dependent oxidoreductase [Amycolatopsis nigrescens]
MDGRTALITGSTGGIGKETARGLARLGMRVLLVGRDEGRAAAAAEELKRDTGNGEIAAFTADVTRQRDLRRLAGQVRDRYDALHVLINNAAANRPRHELTEDGVETDFAANVLAPFVLTRLLLPLLRASAPARVVNITGGIPKGAIDLANLQGERRYVGLLDSQYNHTKRILMAMSYEFAQRLPGTEVTINVAYPGHGFTPGNREMTIGMFPLAARPLAPLLRLAMPVLFGAKAISKASRSSVYLASSDEVAGVHGSYFDLRSRRAEWPSFATDPRNREAIWRLCTRLER